MSSEIFSGYSPVHSHHHMQLRRKQSLPVRYGLFRHSYTVPKSIHESSWSWCKLFGTRVPLLDTLACVLVFRSALDSKTAKISPFHRRESRPVWRRHGSSATAGVGSWLSDFHKLQHFHSHHDDHDRNLKSIVNSTAMIIRVITTITCITCSQQSWISSQACAGVAPCLLDALQYINDSMGCRYPRIR